MKMFLGMLCVFLLMVNPATGRNVGRHRRALLPQFSTMIWKLTGRNPLDYNEYGNFCGLGGMGEPVDQVDRCCMIHDNCYSSAQENECRNVIDLHAPYFAFYGYNIDSNYTVDAEHHKITCNASVSATGSLLSLVRTKAMVDCAQVVCECDAAAAVCFSESPFNEEHGRLIIPGLDITKQIMAIGFAKKEFIDRALGFLSQDNV